MTRPPRSGASRYRVVVYELDHDDRQTKLMDTTATGFVAAAASIHNGEMKIALGDGGTHDLKQHIALFIAGQYQA